MPGQSAKSPCGNALGQPLLVLGWDSPRGVQVFDLQPEDPGMEGGFKADTLRARLAKVLPSLLRLVSLVLVSLPDSRQVREAGAAFVEAHHKALLRILREAASPAIRCASSDLCA